MGRFRKRLREGIKGRIMQKLIELLTGLLPANGKTYTAAAIAGLLAANAALAAAGVIFLPAGIVTVLTYLATALGLVGVRHALAKAESAADGDPFPSGVSDPFLPRRHLGLLLALGLTAGLMGMGCAPTVQGKLGCKCTYKDCGCANAVGGCECRPGGKCCTHCECTPAKRPFKLSALPEGAPGSCETLNDGIRNGWWQYGNNPKDHYWIWWHDDKPVGFFQDGKWERITSNGVRAEKAPWLNVPTGVDQSKLTTEGERLLISGK